MGGLAALALALPSPLLAQAVVVGSGGEDAFYRAYYLEHGQGDLAGAVELYRAAASDSGLSGELRKRAETCARSCAEELAASDFARLVPEDTIAYLELSRPGEQLGRLLGQLGLLQGREGSGAVAVSPLLLESLFGIRGAAVAITAIDPGGGPPSGVAILHPGDMDLVRGLIETALPTAGKPVDAIGGCATWCIENQVFVTTTERLVVASQDRGQIEGVVRRLNGQTSDSLASNEDLAQTMALRGQDLCFLCINAEPILPLVHALIASRAGNDPQVAMALSLLDIDSTRALAGRIGVDDEGISIDIGLQLDEGHQNLVFNLLRMPHVGERTFHLVPEGAAAFVAASLNAPGAGDHGVSDASGKPVVSFMDFGREIFGNVVDVALFAMPSVTVGPHGQPIPDVALAMTVNDVERSNALWQLVLGLAKGATNGGDSDPRVAKVAGQTVARYDIQGVGVQFFAAGDRIVISASDRAIEAAIAAANGRDVLQDPVFQKTLARFSGDHTSAIGISLGRIATVAKGFMPEPELREIGPYLELLKEAVVCSTVRHSDTQLAFSTSLTGLPNVGPMVEGLIRAHMSGGGAVAGQSHAAPRAVAAVRAEPTRAPASPEAEAPSARAAFRELSQACEHDDARKLLTAVTAEIGDDAMALNNLAWALLTEEGTAGHYVSEALAMSERSNELSGHGNWYYLDTLAHAHFLSGHIEEAIRFEEQAIAAARAQHDPRTAEAEVALERFRAARATAGGVE